MRLQPEKGGFCGGFWVLDAGIAQQNGDLRPGGGGAGLNPFLRVVDVPKTPGPKTPLFLAVPAPKTPTFLKLYAHLDPPFWACART